MKEIVMKYKELWKENREKKNFWDTLTEGEIVLLVLGGVVLIVSLVALQICDKSENPSINILLLSVFGIVLSSFFIMYKLHAISSKIFRREDLRKDDWFDKLQQMLRDCGIQSDEEICYLREWCVDAVNEKTEVKEFVERLEKIAAIIIIPTIITVVNVYLNNTKEIILFYKSLLAVVFMLWIGLIIYIVPPLFTGKNSDREAVKFLNRDLIELQIYMKKK